MSEIKLVRVDFRLMHGQVVTNWIKQVSADSILIVDDELSENKFLAQVFLMAAPPGIKVAIRTIEKATDGFKRNIFKNKKILVLFKSVENVNKAVALGFPIEKLQIGGLGGGKDKIMISNELSLSPDEALKLKAMQDLGIEVTFQVTPKDQKISLNQALSIIESKK